MSVPSPEPLKAMLQLPVVLAFGPATLDTSLQSYDAVSVSDPAPPPSVSVSTRLPPAPAATRHAADVSDDQCVACVPVCPALAPALYLLDPRNKKPSHVSESPFARLKHSAALNDSRLQNCPIANR